MLGRRFALAAALGLLLAGCDDEPSQRKAFTAFLQTRILDKPGVHVPRPTADEQTSWGDYAKHYAIITSFNDTLTERVSKPMQAALARGAPRSLQEILDRRADVRELQDGMAALGAELDRQLAAADAARAGLKQPADLQPVYGAAYGRTVTGPASAFKDVMPAITEAFASVIALADFLAQNRSRIRLRGSMVETEDQGLQREIQARITAMNGKSQQVQAAQQRLRSLISGS